MRFSLSSVVFASSTTGSGPDLSPVLDSDAAKGIDSVGGDVVTISGVVLPEFGPEAPIKGDFTDRKLFASLSVAFALV